MKDDPDLNAHFVGMIEANPCIYNHRLSDYSNKNLSIVLGKRFHE